MTRLPLPLALHVFRCSLFPPNLCRLLAFSNGISGVHEQSVQTCREFQEIFKLLELLERELLSVGITVHSDGRIFVNEDFMFCFFISSLDI